MKYEKIMDVRPYRLTRLACHASEAEKNDKATFPNERLKEIYRPMLFSRV